MSLVEEALRRLQSQAKARALAEASGAAAAAVAPEAHALVKDRFLLSPSRKTIFSASRTDPISLAWSIQQAPVLSSQMRALRREISDALRELDNSGNGRVVLISSALPNDGKTFTSIAVARTLGSDSRTKVTLIDGDLPKRNLTRLFGLEAAPGLADCFAGKVPLADIVYRTDVDGINFIPAGTWTPDAADHFASSRLDDLLVVLRSAGPEHVFVMDSTPVLAAGESVYGAARADLVIMIARANETPCGAVVEAIRKLSVATRLGLVLNGHTTGAISRYYGYTDSYDHASGS